MRSAFRIAILTWTLAAIWPLSPLGAEAPAFRIYTDAPGVYRLDHAALVAAGLGSSPIASRGLSMTNLGQPVPIWIEDGGDGIFSDGDYLELAAERLAGEHGYFHEHSRYNIYRLRLDAEAGSRMTRRRAATSGDAPRQALRRTLHLERDELLIRLNGHEIRRSGNSEAWYWTKLTHIDPRPFAVQLDLDDVDTEAAGAKAGVRLHFRGLSLPLSRNPDFADHVVEITLDDEVIGRGEWGGRDLHQVELAIDAGRLAGGLHELAVQVPERRREGSKDVLVDASVLNWIEIDFPSTGQWREGGRLFEPESPTAGRVVRFSGPGGGAWRIYSSQGERIEPQLMADAAGEHLSFESRDADTWYRVADPGNLLTASRVELDRPSELTRTDRGADYLMITHRRLRAATLPLADLHRERGLRVAVIDVQDIYDEFNHGVLHPRAIHDFVAHAYHRWQPPAPRFVLLVGDASWDSKHESIDDANYANWTNRQLFDGDRFVARNTPLVPEGGRSRNLVPTWNYHSSHGHAASDNYFVSVAGDDHLPELAIGRFPVTEPEEVRAIVDKTVRYLSNPPVGPWRRDILWITNDKESYQARSDEIASRLEERGYGALKVYPKAAELDNQLHQVSLQKAFDGGTSLVHFFGHGGRHIWRTGPPNFKKDHDLFTLEHIEELRPSERLPLVLSMTCFSAPFDHPNADSIGEKFIRVDGRGAIAVLAASWRNTPSPSFSQALIDALLVPGLPIGTAIQQVKTETTVRNLVETYNLLGDPSIVLAIPAREIQLSSIEAMPATVAATIEGPGFAGQAMVEWLDGEGAVIAAETFAIRAASFQASYAGSATPDRVRIYAWNEDSGVDAAGSLSLRKAVDPTATGQPTSASQPAPTDAN